MKRKDGANVTDYRKLVEDVRQADLERRNAEAAKKAKQAAAHQKRVDAEKERLITFVKPLVDQAIAALREQQIPVYEVKADVTDRRPTTGLFIKGVRSRDPAIRITSRKDGFDIRNDAAGYEVVEATFEEVEARFNDALRLLIKHYFES